MSGYKSLSGLKKDTRKEGFRRSPKGKKDRGLGRINLGDLPRNSRSKGKEMKSFNLNDWKNQRGNGL